MKTWNLEKIVAFFSIHYTIQAIVGGSQILASSLDTCDEFTETEMSTAIELKVSFKIFGMVPHPNWFVFRAVEHGVIFGPIFAVSVR